MIQLHQHFFAKAYLIVSKTQDIYKSRHKFLLILYFFLFMIFFIRLSRATNS